MTVEKVNQNKYLTARRNRIHRVRIVWKHRNCKIAKNCQNLSR